MMSKEQQHNERRTRSDEWPEHNICYITIGYVTQSTQENQQRREKSKMKKKKST